MNMARAQQPEPPMADTSTSPNDADTLKRRNRELSILNTIARELNSSVDLEQALQATLSQVAALLELHTCWIWLLHEQTGRPYLAAAQRLPPALAGAPQRMEGSCYCLDVFIEGDMSSAANINVVTCSRLKGLVDGTDGLRYHASIPLYAHGRRLGVLNVASADWRELSGDDLRLLYIVGDLVGIAIERARLFAASARIGALEERNRLAREIHDTLAQGLTAITLQLESADALLEAAEHGERSRTSVQRALELTRATLEEARRSVLDLRAAPLEGRPLAAALEALAGEAAEGGQASVTFEALGRGQPLPLRVEAGLYRIAQEALNNALRHADARRIDLRLRITPGEARLLIEDDGRGFDPRQAVQGRYGLVGLNERARLLGGSLRVESCPGAGARLEVVIPLSPQRRRDAEERR
jgi:two-component system NarL family sensor kinase